MRRYTLLTLIAAAGISAAQPQTAEKPRLGSISGVVRDAATGAPVAEVEVFVRAASGSSRNVSDTTAADGRYTLRDLPPGRYSVTARTVRRNVFDIPFRPVTLAEGQELSSIDFRVRMSGTISGKITDDNDEPVPGLYVFVVGREYYLNRARYSIRGMSRTDDKGEYRVEGVLAGQPWLVMAQKMELTLPAISRAPADLKLRKRAVATTFYPDSPTPEGGAPLTLRPGELREAIDIRMQRSPGYCMDGVLDANGSPAALQFRLELDQPSSSLSATGGFYMVPPGGETGPDGRFRICDLYPGDYRLTAYQEKSADDAPALFAVAPVTIADRDVRNLRVTAVPGRRVAGEVVWEGEPPAKSGDAKLSFGLFPLNRTGWRNESHYTSGGIPGEFRFENVPADDYVVIVSVSSPGLYVKDVTYGTASVFHEVLRVGSAMGNSPIRVTVAHDGGTLTAKVVDKDGVPVQDGRVYVLPVPVESEAVLASAMETGATDQNGVFTSGPLRPGKYSVLASDTPLNRSPESIGKLWRSRTRGKETDVGPGGAVQVTLEPAIIE